jgi:hypothetical protein
MEVITDFLITNLLGIYSKLLINLVSTPPLIAGALIIGSSIIKGRDIEVKDITNRRPESCNGWEG